MKRRIYGLPNESLVTPKRLVVDSGRTNPRAMKQTVSGRIRFGVFELDVKAGELRHQDKTILLQEQSFRLLLALLQRSGEVVTREDLQKQLWPNDTVVEFDLGINAAIKRLRRILNDSPEDPKYIETVARRGYRLMVPVQWVPSPDNGEVKIDADRTGRRLSFKRGGLVGEEVSHYRVVEVVARGGMGVIYKAEDLYLGRTVALKFLPEEFDADARALLGLEQEACLASSLNHPNICSIYELGKHGGQPFIAMELLTGHNLRDSLALDVSGAAGEATPAPVEKLLDIAIQVCEGLKAAHEKGIIHRDIKPANIFITTNGVVKILDFGLAKLVQSDTNEVRDDHRDVTPSTDPSVPAVFKHGPTGIAIGTAAYMSPEHILGERLDARTDLFSLGVVLYQMATGAAPFRGETPALLFDVVLHQTPVTPRVLNSALPSELEAIINRALEKDRNLRYPSAAEMQAELRRLASDVAQPPTVPKPRSGDDTATIRRKPAQMIFASALLLVALIGGGLYWRWRAHKAEAIPVRGKIVLADFDNKTGDSVFDDTLRLGTSKDLDQSPFLELLSDGQIAETKGLMGQPRKGRLTPELAREVCVRTGSAATLEGSIAMLGKDYIVGLKAVNCHTGEELAVEQFSVDSKEKVLSTLGNSVATIRLALGESLVSVQEHSVPLQNVTTSSLEALKAYSDAAGANDAGDYRAAIALCQRAIALDPNFAIAYMALGVNYSIIGLSDRGSQYLRKAYDLRDRVSERERLAIETFYADNVTGNTEAAREAFRLWMRVYPNNLGPPTNLANDDTILGDYGDALALYKKVVDAYPRSPLSYSNLAAGYMYLDRLDEVHATAQEATAHHLDPPAMHLILYWTEFLQNDADGMQREKAALMGKPGWEDQVLDIASDSAAYVGQFSKARELTAEAVDSAERAKEKEAAAAYKAEAAVREAFVGNVEIAKAEARAALKLSTSRDAAAISAVALALSGDVAEAKRIADDLNKRFPENTIVQFNYLPTIRAEIALRSGSPKKAIEALAPATAYELGTIQGSASFMLYPVYMRAEAYLAAHQGVASAAEFRKILNHPGVVINEPIGALAHLGLARAYALSGDTAKAETAYQDFFALWKDADPDIPIYKQAKAEYAKLR